MSLLGSDGRGYDLARKLENHGVWRPWFGDALYSIFVPYLSSPSVWETFMRADESKSRAHIHLQLRARALLFDKSCSDLFDKSSVSPVVSKLNPNYLKLHGDDLYFTLESCPQDGARPRESNSLSSSSSKMQSKSIFSGGSRYSESGTDNLSQKFRHEDFPESWYNQFIDKYRGSRSYSLSSGNRESDKRTPEEMSDYLRLRESHKRMRLTFNEDNQVIESRSNMQSNSFIDGYNLIDGDTPFFPETMFTLNSVPDNAPLKTIITEETPKMKFYGVLDTLPQVMTRSTVMIERLGIKPELRGTTDENRICLGQEQASLLSQKVIARTLLSVGFDGGTDVPMEVFSQLLVCHIGKLGRILKVLADSYRKQCSALELLKMFLQTAGYSNFGALMAIVKDGTKNPVKQFQHVQGMQTQLQSQLQSPLRQTVQVPRQMNLQMQQQMINSQNLNFQQQQQQQQLDRMRRRQPPNPRIGVDNMDMDKSLVQVKLENPTELPTDSNNNFNARHPQMQLRQQQIAALSNLHAQSNNQFRQMASLQVPQPQTPNSSLLRAPPVKVEGFQELMGGDASLKLDSEGNKLTSPSK